MTRGARILRTYVAFAVKSVHVEGQENLLPGPKIIVANHPNVTDGFVLPFIVPEKLHVFIQGEAFDLPLVGRLLALADQIPVTLGRGQEALDMARDRLARGRGVALFPEGRLSHGDDLHRARTGAVRLALETGAPLIPLGFYVPPGSARTIRWRLFGREVVGRWQLGGRCFIRVGEPWWPSLVAEADQGYQAVRDLTEKLMAQIADLSQQAMEGAQ